MTRADKGGWFEPAASDAPMSVFEGTIRQAFYGKDWDERPEVCGLFSSRHGSQVSILVANQIAFAEFAPDRTLESHLRRWSLGCQLAHRFSDLQMLRVRLEHAQFNGKLSSADEAARALFRKPAATLDLEESIRLAATYEGPPVLNNPSKWVSRIEYIRKRLQAMPAE
jgi:membrane carboxypeptidase/penicillin-binding protein PbpC